MVPKNLEYCGCSKISNTKVEANSADPDQTASKSLIRLFAVCYSSKHSF